MFFINNYQRLLEMKDLSDIRIRIQQQGGTELLFPPLNIASGEQLIMPFNIDINGHLLHYATVQPLYILKNKVPTYVFLFSSGHCFRAGFSAGQLKKVMMDGRPVKNTGDKYLLKCGQEKEHLIVLSAVNGRQTKILLLTQEQALVGAGSYRKGMKISYVSLLRRSFLLSEENNRSQCRQESI